MKEAFIRVIRENRLVVIAVAALIVIIVIIVLASGGGPEDAGPSAAGDATTTTLGVDFFDADNEGVYADVSPLDCFALLDTDEVNDALASPEIPEDQRGTSGFGQGEVCTRRAVADEHYFVRLEPGDPADFESGSTLLDVAGERVADIGEEALWFGGPGTVDGGAAGALSVRQTTPLGMLYFRLVLGRPDLQSAEQLDVARTLAASTLARFPGMPVGPPEPLVDLCALVTDQEAEEVLGEYRDVHPATQDEVFVTSNSGTVDLREPGGAVCNKLILAEIYVQIQQGSEADFEPGAEIEGTAGEPVAGIGEQAIWFPDMSYQGSFTAPHVRNVLAVRQAEASFRIALALPDTASTDQLEIAGRLAAGALGRIPGSEDLPQHAVIIKPDQVDPAHFSLEGNLRAKVADGEWTVGEGLVATLQLILGRAEPDDVLRHREVSDSNATEIITLAAEYVQGGSDDAARDEVAAFLEVLIPSEEVLSGAFGTDDAGSTASIPLPMAARVATDRSTYGFAVPAVSHRLVPAILAADEIRDFCFEVFGISGGECLARVPMPDVEAMWPGKYELGRMKEEIWPGLTERVDWAKEAVFDSAIVFEQLGRMPKVLVLVLPQDWDYAGSSEAFLAGGSTLTGDAECSVRVGDQAQSEPAFKQRLASLLAWCLLMDGPAGSRVGMSVYLSGVVYPGFNEEHVFAPRLRAEELSTTLPQRDVSNWALFEFMHPFVGGGTNDRLGGALGNLGLFPQLPDSASPFLHQYALGLTDSNVGDIDPDGGVIPYSPPPTWQLHVSGPTESFNLAPPAYGVRRLHVAVAPGMYACLSDPGASGDLEVSWREGEPGEVGDWGGPPATIEGESVFVVTAAGPDAVYNFGVEKVGDNEDCEEEKTVEEVTIPPPAGNVLPCCLSEFFRLLTGAGG